MSELNEAQKNAFKPVPKFESGVAKNTIGVSPKAVEGVRIALKKRGTPEAALRVGVRGGGCSGFSYDLYFDQSTAMDKQYDSHGVRLVVDQMSLQYLRGTEVDYVEGLQGAGFKFQNPNVKSTCGCGSSFSV